MCKGGVVREVQRGVTRNEGGKVWGRLREILECFKAKSLVGPVCMEKEKSHFSVLLTISSPYKRFAFNLT